MHRLLARCMKAVKRSAIAHENNGVTAVNRVFAIPELLEMILAELSALQLFRVQRTSQSFRDVIEGSPNLRCAMGLAHRPGTHEQQKSTGFTIVDVRKHNPLDATLIRRLVTEIMERRLFPYKICLPCPFCSQRKQKRAFVKARRRTRWHDAATWREIKLRGGPDDVTAVGLANWYSPGCGCGCWAKYQLRDRYIGFLPPGEATLGDLEMWIEQRMAMTERQCRVEDDVFGEETVATYVWSEGWLRPTGRAELEPAG